MIKVFWNVVPCSIVGVDRRFTDAYCLHHQGDDGRGSTHLLIIGLLQRDTAALHPRRLSFLIIMSMRWDYVLNCGHQRAYCSSPRSNMNMKNHDEMMTLTHKKSWLIQQSSLAILPAEKSGSKQEKGQKEWEFSPTNIYVHSCKWYLRTKNLTSWGG
jgi:hypothetical protein